MYGILINCFGWEHRIPAGRNHVEAVILLPTLEKFLSIFFYIPCKRKNLIIFAPETEGEISVFKKANCACILKYEFWKNLIRDMEHDFASLYCIHSVLTADTYRLGKCVLFFYQRSIPEPVFRK